MTDDTAPPTPEPMDPATLQDAHGRTGKMFQAAGLPFEDDEFEDEDSSSSSSDTSSSSEEARAGDAQTPPSNEGAGD